MATIRDVAREAGLSPATVSRVLNEDTTFKVADLTRQRVLAAAGKLNYSRRPKNTPVNKRQRVNSSTIGVITTYNELREIDDPYFLGIRNGLNQGAALKQRKLEFLFSLHDVKPNWALVKQCGAIIVIGCIDDQLRDYLLQVNPHLIVVDEQRPGQGYDTVYNDFNDQIGHILDYLCQQGYQEIGFVGARMPLYNRTGVISQYIDDVRYTGYLAWMTQHNLTLPHVPIILNDWDTQATIEALDKMLAHGEQLPRALVAASDPIALGIYHVCQAHNIAIPAQTAVVSFDDIDVTRFLVPTLTTVHLNAEMMGQVAVNLADLHLQGLAEMPLRVKVPSQIIKRDSVGRYPKKNNQ